MANYCNHEDEALFSAIGRMAISWAQLEFSIDAMVHAIFHTFDNPPGDAEIPRSLSSKLRYLKSSLQKKPEIFGDVTKYSNLFTNIKTESVTRHDIIHGTIINHIEGNGDATALRLIRYKESHRFKQINFNVKDILKAAIRAQKLSYISFSWVLKNTEETHQPNGEQNH